MPVRDALRQLVYEGLVESLPGNRLRVAQLNHVDLFDMFWMEATVHALATKRATERMSGHLDDMAELEELQERMMGCSSNGDMAEASRINRIFHRKINLMAESPKLITTLRNVSMGIQGSFLTEVPDWLQRSIEEHRAILAAMSDGSSDDASELMFLHVQASGIKIANDVGRGEGEPLTEETVRTLYPRWMSNLLNGAHGGSGRG
jgi:DNA-binding GntR family transcriptional regulator